MKFGQVIADDRNIFLQTSYRKQAKETSSKPLSAFQKSFIKSKSNWSGA